MGKIGVIAIASLSIFITFIWYGPLGDRQSPSLPDFYFGSSLKTKEDTSMRPFKISIDEEIIIDLKTRLQREVTENNRLTTPLEGIGQEYGFNSKLLRKITTYWLEKYDWTQREKLLNKYPHFKTNIAGIDIHFQHVQSQSKKKYRHTRPLLLLHGWPGSFAEFQKVIPLLTDPVDSDINFEIVVPSLPGYGFSERAHRPGLGSVEMAQIFLKLMNRLGFPQFYVQGGDWGSVLASNMAALYPENVVAVHVNLCMSQHPRTLLRMLVASIYPSFFMPTEDIHRLYPLSKTLSGLIEETGYFHIQATKPDTIGAALDNSPSGLAGYILEKFSTGTNVNWKKLEDGGLLPHFNIDELLDDVMIYWVTNSMTSAMRLYAEQMTQRSREYGMNSVPIKVPAGCLFLPNEPLNVQTEWFLQDKFHQLIWFNRGIKGGHFAAFDVPDIFARDLIKFFNLVETNTTSHFPEKPKPLV